MKKLDFPNRITVELTNRCNVSCAFCPRQKIDMGIGDMKWETYKKIIDEAAHHLPVALVIFFRGESILHSRFIECIKYAKKRGIGPIQFASNALGLEKELAEELVSSGIDFISFSLDTLDAEVYSKSRLTGDLNKSMENVLYLSECCKKREEKGLSFPKLQVSGVDMEEYRDGQKAFIDFWKKHVDVVRIYYEHDEKGHIVSQEIKEKLNLLDERNPCRKVFTDFLVFWNGKTALCNYDWEGYIDNYNINDMTIEEIWNSLEYEKIREMHRTCVFEKNIICADCDHWKIDYMPDGFLGIKIQGER